MSNSTEIFRRRIVYCCINFGYRKSLDKRGEYQDFPSKFFCLTVPKISVGNLLLLQYFRVPKKIAEERGVSRFYVENFLPNSAEIFRRGILYCCIIFGYEKSLDKRGGFKVLRRKWFVSQCRKSPSGILYCCISFGFRKGLDKRGGGVSYFYVENFLSRSAENFRRGILYCCINFGYRKRLEKRGGSITFLRRKLFVTRYRKIFFANSSVYQKFSGIENFYASEGYVTIFCRNFFVSQCQKYSQVKPSMLCFRNFR